MYSANYHIWLDLYLLLIGPLQIVGQRRLVLIMPPLEVSVLRIRTSCIDPQIDTCWLEEIIATYVNHLSSFDNVLLFVTH